MVVLWEDSFNRILIKLWSCVGFLHHTKSLPPHSHQKRTSQWFCYSSVRHRVTWDFLQRHNRSHNIWSRTEGSYGGGIFIHLTLSAWWCVNRNINGPAYEQFKFRKWTCSEVQTTGGRLKPTDTSENGSCIYFLFFLPSCFQLGLDTWHRNVPP